MNRTTLSLAVIAGVITLAAPISIAWACFCPGEVSEERFYRVASITQLEGAGDQVAAEQARWDGVTRMTVGTGGADTAQLWLRVHLSDEQVRNVRIDATAPSASEDTGAFDAGGAR